MSTIYIIRRGEVRGAGDYWTGESAWHADQREAWRFEGGWALVPVLLAVPSGSRVVRLLPAGTMRARRLATVRELRAQAARLRTEHAGSTFAAWAFAAEQLEARAAELEGT